MQEKNAKTNLLEPHQKEQQSTEKYGYLECTERRGDNGKECTTTKEKTGAHECSSWNKEKNT